MNISFSSTAGVLQGIRVRMVKEGARLTDPSQAELWVTDTQPTDAHCPILSLGNSIPRVLLEGFGYTVQEGTPQYWLSRWWDTRWGDQILVGMPISGLMNRGLGPSVEIGWASRYIDQTDMAVWFENSGLEAALREMRHRGFVSLGFWEQNLVACRTGMPGIGWYAVLEGAPGQILDWMLEGGPLLESWVVGTLVTRFPFPVKGNAEPVKVEGGGPHFWSLDNPWWTRLGVACGWNQSLGVAGGMCEGVCQSIEVPGVQYRTDLAQTVKKVWAKVRGFL
jgi:hypothetical protein